MLEANITGLGDVWNVTYPVSIGGSEFNKVRNTNISSNI